MKDNSRLILILISAFLALLGLVLIFFPYTWIGFGLNPLIEPLANLLNSIGVALFLSGTVSLGVQELIKSSTSQEMQAHISELGKRIENLGAEIYGSNIVTISSSRDRGFDEMASAIRNADKFIYMMGISLREFFSLDTECRKAISDVYHKHKSIEFRVLILNNQSLEALNRSSREEGIQFKSTSDPEYRKKHMFVDTESTLDTIKRDYKRMEIRVYDDQSLFLLITDKIVFMEPYHYGDRIIETAPHLVRLAELVPLIEFKETEKNGPYNQFFGHYKYMFERAKTPGVDDKKQRPV